MNIDSPKEIPFDKEQALQDGNVLVNILQNPKPSATKINQIFKKYLVLYERVNPKDKIWYSTGGHTQDFFNCLEGKLTTEHFIHYFHAHNQGKNNLVFSWSDFWHWGDFIGEYQDTPMEPAKKVVIEKHIQQLIKETVDWQEADSKNTSIGNLLESYIALHQRGLKRQEKRQYSDKLQKDIKNLLIDNIDKFANHQGLKTEYIKTIIAQTLYNDQWNVGLDLIKKYQVFPANINELILDGYHQGSAQHYGVHNQPPEVTHDLVDYLIEIGHIGDELNTHKQNFYNYYYSYFYKSLYDHPCFFSPLMVQKLKISLEKSPEFFKELFLSNSHIKMNSIKKVVDLYCQDNPASNLQQVAEHCTKVLKNIGGGPEDLALKKNYLVKLKAEIEIGAIKSGLKENKPTGTIKL